MSTGEPARALDWPLVLVCWFPHSGGRWLNRGLLGRHPAIAGAEFFSPFLNHSTEDLLQLDTTSQVHKARSLSELEPEFLAVRRSLDTARRTGIWEYLKAKKELLDSGCPERLTLGALPCGSNIGIPDFDLLLALVPRLMIVHLVRDPLHCFASLKSRHEMNGDPFAVSSAWIALNSAMRSFGNRTARRDAYHLVRFEDLKLDPKGEVSRLLRKLALEWCDALEAGIADYHGRNQSRDPLQDVTSEEADIIGQVTTAEGSFYGYGGETTSRAGVA